MTQDMQTQPAPTLEGRRELPPVAKRRRPGLIALGVVLVVVLFLGFMAALNSSGQSTQVLALAATVSRGEQIEPDDLTTVEVPSDTTLAVFEASQFEDIVGQYAAVDLLPGSTLTTTAVTTELAPEPGYSVVGVALSTTQLPAQDLAAGDHVRIVDTPPAQGDPPSETPTTLPATVLSTTPAADGSPTVVIDLLVPEEDAPALAARAATGRIALIIDTVQAG